MATFARRYGTLCRRYDWREFRRFGPKSQLGDWVLQYQVMDCGPYPVVFGMPPLLSNGFVAQQKKFLYCDHAYFERGWDNFNFRLVRDHIHLTTLLDRPDDRLKRWKVQIDPWRKTGRSIVVIPPGFYHTEIFGLGKDWARRMVENLGRWTDRPVVVKSSKGRLREFLLEEVGAFAVVCCSSVAGMEAALMGVPVFSTPHCCSWPINAGEVKNIERPEYRERHAWACGLAYASWNAEELETIDFRDYYYSVKEQPCAS